jgi:GNAT superfamily N-acetyltransferase
MVCEEGCEVVAAHELGPGALAQAAAILNWEWPRSETIRLRGLESSSPLLPCSLLLLARGGDPRVLGQARLSRVPALSGELFLESVVVHPGLRGLGLGRLLVLQVEEWCRRQLGATALHLTTHDQQVFYSRCGYSFSQPVCAFGGSSKLKMDIFSKAPPSVESSPPSRGPGRQAPAAPPATACGPPPPPPPPPPRVSASDVWEPDAALLAACAAAFATPELGPTEAMVATRLKPLPAFPGVDMETGRSRNTEDAVGKMFMKKQLFCG